MNYFEWIRKHQTIRHVYLHNWSGKWFVEISLPQELWRDEDFKEGSLVPLRVEARDINTLEEALDISIKSAIEAWGDRGYETLCNV